MVQLKDDIHQSPAVTLANYLRWIGECSEHDLNLISYDNTISNGQEWLLNWKIPLKSVIRSLNVWSLMLPERD